MQGDKKVKSKRFRQLNEQEKKKMIQSAKGKNPEGIIVIAQCHPLCDFFQDLPEFRYIVNPIDKIKQVDTKIKKRIAEADKKFASQSVFLFTKKLLLNRQTSFEELNNKHKNFKDGVLYIYFANVDSF